MSVGTDSTHMEGNGHIGTSYSIIASVYGVFGVAHPWWAAQGFSSEPDAFLLEIVAVPASPVKGISQ